MAEEKSNSIPPNEKSNETYIDKAVNLSPEGSEPSAKGLSTYHEFANEEAQQDEEISTAKFQNPLSGLSQEELFADVDKFCRDNELAEYIDVFRRGALVAQNPKTAHELEELTNEDKESLQHEIDHKWSHPWALYNLVIMCSVAAAVQGMDETVNNGAQQFYLEKFGIVSSKMDQSRVDNLTGLIVGAPYLACATIGCWITEPLNRFLGRRGTIFLTCFIAAVASIWEGVCNSWPNLLVARLVLGLGIGPKSSTVPVYTAECSPAPIRGALVMMWQMWTAFGIMLGNIMGVAFGGLDKDLGWRLMLGSTVVLPLIVCAEVFFCPESPRWLIEKNKIAKAFRSFQVLRGSDLKASRDLYYAWKLVELERKANHGKYLWNMAWELFSVPRNARATLASFIVMFLQQFCGVNIIAYYSTAIFQQSGFSMSSALLASMGIGLHPGGVRFAFGISSVYLPMEIQGDTSNKIIRCSHHGFRN
ncbi:General substrate transporter [Ascosphaera apis ARSEF 7405]|uniref:General substrate transporter n=1 Tax=Ascosphaera apis ARSEF 7405 TaxID=392613 RepID=A0A168C7W7_9EURO|nr:General substrate transporter [Ascosphaera apis ARSEF 7405]